MPYYTKRHILFYVEKSEFVEVLNEKCINDWTVQHGWDVDS